jgi:hypothetical protein
VNVVSTDLNDFDDEIDRLVIGPKLSMLNDATEASLTVGFSYSTTSSSLSLPSSFLSQKSDIEVAPSLLF